MHLLKTRFTMKPAGLFLPLALAAVWACATPAFAAELANDDCMACHSDPALTTNRNGHTISFCINTNEFAASVHADLSCTDCHKDIKALPHEGKIQPASCVDCHEKATKEYGRSIHWYSGLTGSAAAKCADCHGHHNILPVKDPLSPVFKLNLPATCGNCHSNPDLVKKYRIPHPDVETQYEESIHGRALTKMGLVVVPSCNNCHGVHDIRRSLDRDSPVNHANISKTCGGCHVGIVGTYNASVHGQLLLAGDARGPTCADCHTSHSIESPRAGHFKATSDERCGGCHVSRLKHYRETYHGKAMALGKPNTAPDVAACYDCHGHHDVQPASNPLSRLSETNLLKTCQQCHPGASRKFTEYMPHADPLDGKNYPLLHATFVFMTALLIGVFVFFGIHTAFWLFRVLYLYASDSKKFREAKTLTQKGDEWFVRFPPFHRFLHILVITSFLLLVITGAPLKFYEAAWAKVLFAILGGPDVARWLHHFGAAITFLYFLLHGTELLVKCWRGRSNLWDPQTGRFSFQQLITALFGPDSMLPNLQDLRDFVAHQRWFFGKGPRPQFDRWTYWEKFDYLAVFWGVAMIGLSGLVMWFPVFFTKFLPGWVINIALIIHSDEALLAAGFIFTFHFFNTHFRPDKFPLDTVMFSGRISKTEMLHERRRWYDRLLSTKTLDDARLRDEWERTKPIAKTLGFIFFGIGLMLLVLIVYAMILRFRNGSH